MADTAGELAKDSTEMDDLGQKESAGIKELASAELKGKCAPESDWSDKQTVKEAHVSNGTESVTHEEMTTTTASTTSTQEDEITPKQKESTDQQSLESEDGAEPAKDDATVSLTTQSDFSAACEPVTNTNSTKTESDITTSVSESTVTESEDVVKSEQEKPADNTEQSADNTEQSADNTEQSADNTKQSADNTEQSADNTEQSVVTSEKSTDATEKSADSKEQSADDIEKSVDTNETVKEMESDITESEPTQTETMETTEPTDSVEKKTPAKRAGKRQVSPKRKATPSKRAKKQEKTEDKEMNKVVEEAMDQTDKSQLGSLERPVEIQTGKRMRKKVERLSETFSSTPEAPADKKVVVPAGAGVRLGDCPAIEANISKTKAEDLKAFHRLLFGVMGKSHLEVKKNIRNFCGWTFSTEDSDYKRKHSILVKLAIPVLKKYCELLKLEKGRNKETIIERILSYLILPTSGGKELKAASSVSANKSAAASKRKRSGARKPSTSKKSDEEEDEEEEDEEEPTAEPPAKRKRAPAKKSTPAKRRGRGDKSRAAKAKEESEDETGMPTDAKIRKDIQKILKTADMETVTIKSIREQIIDMYPDADISSKKDFIKSTVKEVLGA